MAIVARTVGGPGSGKTHRLMGIVEMVLDRLVRDPMRVGFVSFTRAARREAAQRAASKFNVKVADLERAGWFRTLHSVAYKCLGVGEGELLTGTKADNEWLQGAVQDDYVRLGTERQDDDYLYTVGDISNAGRALGLWDLARSRQVALSRVWEPAYALDSRIPHLDDCERIATLYEDAKAKDGRLDFGDLLLHFAGRRWTGDHTSPWEDCSPDGNDISLPVWIHDEAQDMSELSSRVFKRLIATSQWVYLAGDHAQAIYGWAGSDGNIFADWPVSKHEELPVSYRCGQAILDKAYRVLSPDLRFASRKDYKGREGGEVRGDDWEPALDDLRPGEDVLVLCRTNEYARNAGQLLNGLGLPWKPIKGSGGFAAPARATAITALSRLRQGEAISPEDFWRILQLLPAKTGGTEIFSRGTKTWFSEEENRATYWPITLDNCVMSGATPAGQEMIAGAKYFDLLDPAERAMASACEKYGEEAVLNPSCRVGTIHASKGLECDKVVLLNEIPFPTLRAIQENSECLGEERRVWYTGITRARHEVVLVAGRGNQFDEV